MPTYQYACTACDEHLEVVQKFSDDPLTECSECGGRLRKVFSPVGIVFKGSGFYRTDSRNGSSVNGGRDKAKDSTDSASGTADKKPASESGKSTADAKPTKKADATSGSTSSSSSSTGTKVA
ncbi:MAG TPA: FmdB family zinc ribbon protein [Streptosporangiaceae bacterium]|nr:FmdB family zinc ribbon protein [Streptosporangiaceae bacterium]